ncbi:MAG: LPS export ABC transporter periplasmic protein LptC [Armatimonadota bacterium]|nr:LPS export ABC transporter periplasmic protein LptC [Armatimonadota bacterium]MDR7451353.1 LPS export ABC transporter periplasmic protein LptC [Armatimonadota bacterium]MDR7466497.1 LPS export ABC transporter periplasmic protein LptC [Armatimonadota bacterium]MDR7493219.1 LPS export ABC transporter periplasmic protein LptC [Armatimonadota bacterium]MDR7499428.1 LPS export ABC transporter periplasmic protein LptC [Armatimonadota bacterium]
MRLAAVAAALVLGALIGARWMAGRVPAPPAAPPAPSPTAPAPAPSAGPAPGGPESPFLRIEGTTLSGTDPRGNLVWEIRATTLEVDRARERIVMTSVTGQFYQAHRPRLAFAAPTAVFHTRRRDVELTGGVTARTSDGRTLRAARIRYLPADRVIVASGDVVLTQPGVWIRADEVRTDPALNRQRFSGQIVVRATE